MENLMASRIEPERSNFEDRRGLIDGPTKQDANSSGQFAQRERFHEIVVGSGIETGDLFVHRITGCQHQHPRRPAVWRVVANLTANLKTVNVGHGQIEADQVVWLKLQPVECIEPAVGHIDGVALASQTCRHRIGEVNFIINNQDSHNLNGSAQRLFGQGPLAQTAI